MSEDIELTFKVDSVDPELQAIEVIMILLRTKTINSRLRILTYVTDRNTEGIELQT